jgi:hypothetical protein
VVLEEVVIPAEKSGDLARVAWRWVGMIKAPVWDDPREKSPVFKLLDEVDKSSFVVADSVGVQLLRSLAGCGAAKRVFVAGQVDRVIVLRWSGWPD